MGNDLTNGRLLVNHCPSLTYLDELEINVNENVILHYIYYQHMACLTFQKTSIMLSTARAGAVYKSVREKQLQQQQHCCEAQTQTELYCSSFCLLIYNETLKTS